jgi:hypothetical protein
MYGSSKICESSYHDMNSSKIYPSIKSFLHDGLYRTNHVGLYRTNHVGKSVQIQANVYNTVIVC